MDKIIAKDVGGKVLNVGDSIIFGSDNGSTLDIGIIYKITPKKIWFKSDGWNMNRDHSRVAKYEVQNG